MRLIPLLGLILSSLATAALPYRGGMSGSWYDPARDGEGLIVHQLNARQVLVYWFTYDSDGSQLWLTGTGRVEGNGSQITDLWQTEGPTFGANFDPDDLSLNRFGSLRLTTAGCEYIDVQWQREQSPQASGAIRLQRLNEVSGLDCSDSLDPIGPVTWRIEAGSGPGAVSYAATAVGDGTLFVAGGAGQDGFRDGFFRRDPDGAWEALPSLPESRIGAAMVVYRGKVYFFGGAGYTGFGGGVNCISLICGEVTGVGFRRGDAYRYDPAIGEWEDLPNMPQSANMGGAAVLDDQIWVLDGWTTNLLRFDPELQTWEQFDGPGVGPRAQSALVALDGELWLIGGRTYSDEQQDVFIYTPSRNQWREGPRLRMRRAGHAAVVVAGQIVVSGGERWFGQARLEDSSELYVPGQPGWLELPTPEVGVHGGVLIVAGGQVEMVGGSIVPRRAVNADVSQLFYLMD